MQSHAKLPSLIAELSPTKKEMDCKTSKRGIMDFEDAETTGGDEDLLANTQGEDQILRSICSLLEEEEDIVMVVSPHTPGLLGSF
jgi:hypothetical protein